jgi:hypothetical protein
MFDALAGSGGPIVNFWDDEIGGGCGKGVTSVRRLRGHDASHEKNINQHGNCLYSRHCTGPSLSAVWRADKIGTCLFIIVSRQSA